MRNKAGFILIVALLMIALTWSVGCRKDVEVPFPPTLIGAYSGIYSILVVDGIDTLVDTLQYVTFRFTNSTYLMKLDKKLQDESSQFFCDVEGEYKLESGVQFDELDDNLTNKVCTPGHNPTGAFGLNQSTGTDTIRIKQDIVNDDGVRSIKTLELVLEI